MTGRQLYDKLYRRFHRFLRLKAGAVSPASPGTSASFPYRRDGGYAAGAWEGLGPTAEAGEENRWGDRAGPSMTGVAGGDGDDDMGDGAGVRPCMGTGEDEDCPRSVRATSVWVAAQEVNRWGFRWVGCCYTYSRAAGGVFWSFFFFF